MLEVIKKRIRYVFLAVKEAIADKCLHLFL